MPLPERPGRRPLVSTDHPVEQITQCTPAHLREQLAQMLGALPGVQLRPSFVCVPGTLGAHLSPALAHAPAGAFLSATEFGHLHPPYDGSLHLALPQALASEVIRNGWGVPAAPSGSVLVYGPRDEQEAAVARGLLLASYRYACAWEPPVDDAGEPGPIMSAT
ncbi:hypothetical protein GCM10009760_27890 [Kitasatospora kazusensis]|uniref:Luciferase domain-containing protein n=1 Tax=Kitasatospora kazusensis TaxID=407974 RepID=A0ABN2ZIM1_9ACTN